MSKDKKDWSSLKGPKRMEGETYEKFKIRRKMKWLNNI